MSRISKGNALINSDEAVAAREPLDPPKPILKRSNALDGDTVKPLRANLTLPSTLNSTYEIQNYIADIAAKSPKGALTPQPAKLLRDFFTEYDKDLAAMLRKFLS